MLSARAEVSRPLLRGARLQRTAPARRAALGHIEPMGVRQPWTSSGTAAGLPAEFHLDGDAVQNLGLCVWSDLDRHAKLGCDGGVQVGGDLWGAQGDP